MEEEIRLLVLLYCSQADSLRFGASCRAASSTLASTLEVLVLDVMRAVPQDTSEYCKKRDWPAVCRFLLRHTRVRRLSLRGTQLHAKVLEALLLTAPSVVECDVAFALPLRWPAYSALRQRPELQKLAFSDTLAVEPGPELSPQEVVIAQAYGLHAGRVDVCFRFASPANKAMTGPLERFALFFEGSSRYSAMLRCESFSVDGGHSLTSGPAGKPCVEFEVEFRDKDEGSGHLFAWKLSRQTAPEVAGCWMTDGVIPLDIESMWDGSMTED
uniref:Uncharacterized protein n=1 Tax=Alexandrium monilatum TaxID=311494 RepID=A0A7S4WBE8_9DINO|mmetsp:Transcript_36805/g.109951  ORF Transcript_36805/g.109951 Transcript_36805/m.109951 type:complete len:271 (-) Transcript_36805:3-815(-)